MNKIRILDETISNKIAAGEVIRRPSSVVKELVENSIDAGASNIQITIKNGGMSYIKVSDNGCGLGPEDALIAFERHATSKISSAEDLFNINSFGFRGEALPSIAVISRVEMITCPYESISGTFVKIDGGTIKKVRETGAPHGTNITVQSLFYNTPARRKYLKSYSVEAAYVVEVIEKFMISHPEISFKFVQDNREIYNTSGNGNRLDVIFKIFGREVAAEMLPIINNANLIGENENVISVEGFLSKPSVARNYNKYINVFINNRYVKSRLINKAVLEAYKEILAPKKFPVAAINIVIDFDLIDVNVHPSKEEVAFSNERKIFETVKEACIQTLKHHNLVPNIKIEQFGFFNYDISYETNDNKIEEENIKPETYEQQKIDIPSSVEVKKTFTSAEINKPITILPTFTDEQKKLIDENVIRVSKLPKLRPVGQIAKTYIIAETHEGMLIIDQHVAHERVIFDKLMENCTKIESMASQGLLFPVTIELNYSDALIFEQNRHVFTKLGFEVEKFGEENMYIIRAIPAFVGNIKEKEIVMEIIDGLVSAVKFKETEELKRELMIITSCKSAIKANTQLSMPEMLNLLEELAKTENPYICPHGRPIIFSLSLYELNKRFQRTIDRGEDK